VDYAAQGGAAGCNTSTRGALVHRDIKPGNLLLDRTGTVKVLDLGLARFVDRRQDELTKKMGDGCMLGTADYIAPEQALSTHDADIRADIYSLGGTLYFMLSGHVPFEGLSVTQKLLAAQLRAPRPLAELRPDLSPGLVAIVERMMHKDPDQRYQAPAAVLAALAEVGAAPEAFAFAAVAASRRRWASPCARGPRLARRGAHGGCGAVRGAGGRRGVVGRGDRPRRPERPGRLLVVAPGEDGPVW